MKNSIFEETYNNYLKQVTALEYEFLAEKLGVRIVDNDIEISFFNEDYRISGRGITDSSGRKPLLEICVTLCRYLIMAPETEPVEKDWVSFRDFKDAGPLTVFFTNDIEQFIAGKFSGKTSNLLTACKKMGGFIPEIELSYDLSMQFRPLPKLPLLLLFNDSDDEFPAHASVLFQKGGDTYLDAECLAIVGSLFANYLIRQ